MLATGRCQKGCYVRDQDVTRCRFDGLSFSYDVVFQAVTGVTQPSAVDPTAGVRPHKTLANPYPRTPAMAADGADHVWRIEEIIALLA